MRLYVDIDFSLKSIFLALVGIEIFFLVADSIIYSFSFVFAEDFRKLFDITLESNLPTWFSSTQVLVVGIVAYFIGHRRRLQNEKRTALAWFLFAVFFAYIGVDDAAQLHERLATIMAESSKGSDTPIFFWDAIKGFPSYYWQVLFLPIFGGFGLFMLIFLYREFDEKEMMMLFVAGIGCYTAAVGLDYFDGISRNYKVITENTLFSFNDARHQFRAIEEFIEMLGTTFILVSFLKHWNSILVAASTMTTKKL